CCYYFPTADTLVSGFSDTPPPPKTSHHSWPPGSQHCHQGPYEPGTLLYNSPGAFDNEWPPYYRLPGCKNAWHTLQLRCPKGNGPGSDALAGPLSCEEYA